MSATDDPRRAAILEAADARGWFRARKTAAVWVRALERDRDVESREGTLRGKAGDMLCRGPDGEPWVQARETLRAKYRPTGERDAEGFERWSPEPSTAAVRASRLTEAVELPTPWGPMQGQPGDLLVTPQEEPPEGEARDVWIVARTVFDETYERTAGEGAQEDAMHDEQTEDPLAFLPIPIPIPESAGRAPPTDVVPRRVLDYDTVTQEQTQWCWAAVALAVARYFAGGETKGTPAAWSQCRLVNETFDATGQAHPDCCKEPKHAACNKPYYVYRSLEQVGHYAGRKQGGKPDYTLPRGEIDAGRPFVILLKWVDGGGHFVTLYGYDESASPEPAAALLHVGDPWAGDALVSYGAFPSTYQGGASWAYSYWTKGTPPAAGA